MNKITARVLLLSVLLMTLFSGGVPEFRSYATGGFSVQPAIIDICTTVNFKFTPAIAGKVFYFITDADAPPLNPYAAYEDAKTAAPIAVDAYLKTSLIPVTANEVIGTLDISSIPSGRHYKLEVFFEDLSGDVPAVLPALFTPKFYKATLSALTIVNTHNSGVIAQITSDAPGKIYSTLVASAATVTAADLFADPPALSIYSVPLTPNLPTNLKLMGQTPLDPTISRKVRAAFKDIDGNKHTIITSSEDVKTNGLRLLDVYYDNGDLTAQNDDKVIMQFDQPVTNFGNANNYRISFDKDASVYATDDIVLDDPMYDFTPSIVGNTVVLTLQKGMPDKGIEKIDTAAEFDNGVMKVEMVNTTNIAPLTVHKVKTIQLTQTDIQRANTPTTQLVSMTYEHGDVSTRTDDSIIVTLSDPNTGVSPGPADSLLLTADNNQSSGFDTPEISFIRGTDYQVINIDGTQKRLTFTASGVGLLNGLGNAVLRLKLGNPAWGMANLDPSIHTLYTSISIKNFNAQQIHVFGKPIPGFNPNITEYSVTVPYGYNDMSPFIATVPYSPYACVYTSEGDPGIYNVALFAPNETMDQKIYSITLNVEPSSVKSLRVDNVMIPQFDPLQSNYTVVLPPGTSVVPNVQVQLDDTSIPAGSIVKSQSGSLPGEAVVTFTVTHGQINKVITVAFLSSPAQPADLIGTVKSLKINGTMIPNFSPTGSRYDVNLPAGTVTVPDVQIEMNNSDIPASHIVKSQSGTLPGLVIVNHVITFGPQTKVVSVYFQSSAVTPVDPTPPSGGGGGGGGGGGTSEPDSPIPTPTPSTPTLPPVVTPPNPNVTPPPTPVPAPVDTTQQLTQTIQTFTVTPSAGGVVGQLEKVNELLLTSGNTSQTQLIGVLSQMDTVLQSVGSTLPTAGGTLTQAASNQVVQLTETVEKKILQIGNAQEALKVTEDYLKGLSDLSKKSSLRDNDLNKSVEDILTGINKKLGTLAVEQPKDPKQAIDVPVDALKKAIDQQAQFAQNMKALNTLFFGDTDTRKIQTSIVIALDQPAGTESLQTKFNPETVALLKTAKIGELSVDVGGTILSVPSENFGSQAEYVFSTQSKSQPGGSSTITPGTVARPERIVEFKLLENGLVKETFAKPLELSFNLSDFGLTGTDGDFSGIYKLNESTGAWFVVGGVVDEQSGMIVVKRGSLSQYTVMKSKKSFSDSDTSWAKNEIDSLLSKGVVESTTKFEPKALLTRGEFASWIAKAYGLSTSSQALPFTDINKKDKNYDAVAAVYQLGIINGKSKNKFDPNGNITADEMAVILGKTLVLFNDKQGSAKVKSKHLDSLKSKSVASWAEGDQALLMELGISGSNAFAKGNELVSKETAAATFSKFYKS